MENLGFTLKDVVFILTLIASVFGIVKIYQELRRPSQNLQETVDTHTVLLAKDFKKIQRLEKGQALIIRCIYNLIESVSTHNNIENLKRDKEAIHNFLLNNDYDNE